MHVMIYQPTARETERMQANREELVERIARAMREDGITQPLPGFYLYRRSSTLQLLHGVSEPSVAVIAQGSKEVLLGENRYRYGPSQYLLATVELPTIRRVLEASKERPYLSLRLELAPTLVGSVMLEAGHSSHSSLPGRADVRGIDVSLLDANLLDACAIGLSVEPCGVEIEGVAQMPVDQGMLACHFGRGRADQSE